MSHITMNIEFLAGTSILDAVTEARNLCRRMNIALVCFDFNGVKMSISQNCCVSIVAEKFHKALNSNKLKVVVE